MKKVKTYLFLAGLGLITSNANAQYVFIVQPGDTINKPTHRVELVQDINKARWVVTSTVDRQEAERMDGFWFLTRDPSIADFFVDLLVDDPVGERILVYLTENELKVRVDY